MRLLLSTVTQRDPVVAVFDGQRGNEYRRRLLPTYKGARNRFRELAAGRGRAVPRATGEADLREAMPLLHRFLGQCHVPVVRVEDAEADDVVATLASQALARGLAVVVASPDADFRQLLACDRVQLAVPRPDLGRWSFYTAAHFEAQHGCHPSAELGLRAMLGDPSDSVPGLAHLAPGFGRRTALKLMRRHASLEAVLAEAAVRTVGKPNVQAALLDHRSLLLTNLEVLSLRRDVDDVVLHDSWCQPRSTVDDAEALRQLEAALHEIGAARWRGSAIAQTV
eukprot:SM000219S06676  [mRNA]  locus=s219:22967:24324:- [translate_table: standard]